MGKGRAAVAAVLVFAVGIGVGVAAQKKIESTSAMYRGQDDAQAANALLAAAMSQAGKGSWEKIGVGRAYYLGGMKAEGQRVFDTLLAGDHEDSDVYRIARVYREAGEWEKAKVLFHQYLGANPEDEKALAEIGAYYLLAGDRETAERLFDRSVSVESKDVWATLAMADAYLGVVPQE